MAPSTVDQEELDLIRSTVNEFVARHVAPYYDEWERAGIFPRELWRLGGETGLLCVDIPSEYGGVGASYRAQAAIGSEFARQGFASVGGGFGVHSDIVAHYFLNHGTEEQKRRFLPPMATGELVTAVLMTEPGTGSDLQAVATVARRTGDGFVLNGSKTFITNGQHADLGIVVAKTDLEAKASQGTSLLVVDLHAPGVSRGRNLEKIGFHSSDTSELFFEDVELPGDAILGEENFGFYVLMQELARERMGLAIGGVAACRGALDLTLDYVRQREAFGRTLSKFQNTRFRIAEMETEYRLNRAFVEECVGLFERGELDPGTASMAKLATSEAIGRIADGCLQLFGGYGYMTEYPISRFFVDARVQRIFGGTSEIMKELISRSILGGLPH